MNTKQLATLPELQNAAFDRIMKLINQVAADTGLLVYTTYSRIWEYPWAWFCLEPLKKKRLTVLDIGSERSAFPWFLATQGFDVIISDANSEYWDLWQRASRELKVSVRKRMLDAQELNIPTASVDIYLSISVIEHVPNKEKTIEEASRVLRPGGLLIMTFDICEKDMGMTFPKHFGHALTMQEFDDLFKNHNWFEPGVADIPWNTDAIPDYLAWNRMTAPWHNYITGATVVRRNNRPWINEPIWRNPVRILRGKFYTLYSVIDRWHVQPRLKAFRYRIPKSIKSIIRKIISLFHGNK